MARARSQKQRRGKRQGRRSVRGGDESTPYSTPFSTPSAPIRRPFPGPPPLLYTPPNTPPPRNHTNPPGSPPRRNASPMQLFRRPPSTSRSLLRFRRPSPLLDDNDDDSRPHILDDDDEYDFADRYMNSRSLTSSSDTDSLPAINRPVMRRYLDQAPVPELAPATKLDSSTEVVNITNGMRCNVGNENCNMALDFIEGDVDLRRTPLDENQIIFYKSHTQPVIYPKDQLMNDYNSGTHIFYECLVEQHGSVNIANTTYPQSYFKLTLGSGNYMVDLNDMYQVLSSKHQEWMIVDRNRRMNYMASRGTTTPQGTSMISLLGTPVNTASADHCQAGSDKGLYTLVPVKFNVPLDSLRSSVGTLEEPPRCFGSPLKLPAMTGGSKKSRRMTYEPSVLQHPYQPLPGFARPGLRLTRRRKYT